MTNDFVPELPIDHSLYQQETQTIPWLTWYGKHTENNAATGGTWGIKAEFLGERSPQPEGWWKLIQKQHGSSPNDPPEPTWTVQRLRTVFIGVRRRFLQVEKIGDREIEHPFSWGTAREKRTHPDGSPIGGKLRYHYQILTPNIGGIDMLAVITLKGFAKPTFWENNPKGRYGKDGFPTGVEPKLIEYTNDWNKRKKVKWQWLNTWIVDLVPMFQNGQPYWMDVGRGMYMNPFQIDMRTSADVEDKYKDSYPESRFVGVEKFIEYQNMRQEIARDWEAEWVDGGATSDAAYDYEDTSENEVKEDDVVPF